MREERIELNDGTLIPYDRLLICSGASYLDFCYGPLGRQEMFAGSVDLSDAEAIKNAAGPG